MFLFVFIVLILLLVAVSLAFRSRQGGLKRYAEEHGSVGPSGAPPIPDDCLRCHGQLQSVGVEEFRVGGTGGGWKLLFGEWAELGEEKVPLDVYVCTNCRRVELRVPAR